jgi:hypothetical protein
MRECSAVRGLTGVLLSVAMACGLAACGQTSKTTHTSASITARPAGAPVAQSMTKAQAIGFAHKVNLRPTDVPGFRVSTEKESTSAAEKHIEHELMRCLGASNRTSKSLVEAKSQEFERETSGGHQSVNSEVEVTRSSTVAALVLAVIRSGRVQGCLSHYLALLFETLKQKGVVVSHMAISRISAPLPATPSSFGYRITASFTVKGITVPFTIDIFAFLHGPAIITLFTAGVPEPFPAASEQQLFGLLVKRANTPST